jgi:polysaccharide biosynthesis protein VpsJ
MASMSWISFGSQIAGAKMASTTASAGSQIKTQGDGRGAKDQIAESLGRLSDWLEKNDYRGYDTFDGLNAKYLRPLTFETNFLRTVLQQGVRRFPFNLRPVLAIPKSRSTKGMGYLAKGFMRLQQATGDAAWGRKAESALQWLVENESKGYSGACWGNHFDYQSRSFYLPKGVPTIVWTSLIGHAFLDAYDHFRNDSYLQVAISACEQIVRDLDTLAEGDALCLSYIPTQNKQVHNSNTLGASLLARTYSHAQNEAYRSFAEKAIRYTANHQHPDGSWYYGEATNLHWVDNFHTAYVLDCFKHYATATGDEQFEGNLSKGYQYWKRTFFLADGTPRYYDHKTLPLDIQCSSQAIDTMVFFHDRDPENLPLALNVAKWTIENMQDRSGYFYYRRYSRWVVNKTPTLHWGQATMFCALAGLYRLL